MSTILVTGGCGFIGANLVPQLVHSGHQVRVLDNLSRGRREYLQDIPDIEIIENDICSSSAMEKAVKDVDVVIHLAAFGSVTESVRDPTENFNINVHGTFNVLDACRKSAISQMIFASTGGALIGNAEPPVNEQSVPRPISPYGSSKLCGEGYCSGFSESFGIKITALRFANVIGPYSGHKKGAVTAFMKAIVEDRPITIYGEGLTTRDFLFVEDLCDGIIKALHANLNGFNVMHLSSGREVRIIDLAKQVIKSAGKQDYKIVYLPRRRGEVERNFANYDLARRLIGFEPRNSLVSALEKTWRWFGENGF